MGCTTSNHASNHQGMGIRKFFTHTEISELNKELGAVTNVEDQLDVRKICMLMWKGRNLPEMVELVTDVISNHADEKEIFDQIEFYLPQLAHMVINLEVDWDSEALEHFVLMVSQQSTHFALQLHFILLAAMEDFQPEDEYGQVNPNANPLLYMRCATMLHNVERSVVFGSPRADAFERMYHQGKLTKQELHELQRADRKFCAAQIAGDTGTADVLEGVLEYKRWAKRKGLFHFKRWRERRFRVEHRVLLCFRISDGVLKRAIPLADTTITAKEHHEKKFYFEIQENNRARVYKLNAPDAETRDKWIKVLQAHAAAPPPHMPFLYNTENLTSAECARYGFFRSEREFVRSLTDICEEMRFIDPKDRAPVLLAKLKKLDIPECVYLPLCRSTDPWGRVLQTIPEDGRAFSTRKRCPCRMTFEIGFEAPGNMDVASYLYSTLGQGNILPDETIEDDLGPEVAKDWKTRFANSARKSVKQDPLAIVFLEDDNHNNKSPIAVDSIADMASPSSSSMIDVESSNHAQGIWDTKTEDPIRKTEKRNVVGARAKNLIDNVKAAPPTKAESKKMAKALNGSVKTLVRSTQERTFVNEQTYTTLAKEAVNGKAKVKLIAKSFDDLRQEVFCMQLIQFLKDIWLVEKIPVLLKTYRILSTSKSTGLLELIDKAKSFDEVKKSLKGDRLLQHFQRIFTTPEDLAQARKRFSQSLAGYSMICYILSIKDRHNGNVMLCDDGSIAHIDFGFLFGQAPGKDKVPYTNFSMERAEFKFTNEMMEVIGGFDSDNFREFRDSMIRCLLIARAHSETLLTLVEIMGFKSKFPCFQQPGGGVQRVVRELKARLFLKLPDKQMDKVVDNMIHHSLQNRGTIIYERFQEWSNGISPIY